jgi:RNA polymerase sigma-70 factor, ECF subfamily
VTETAIPAAASPAQGVRCRSYDGTDDSGFAAFYAKWHPQLRRWAMQHHGEANAEEIAQETLCRAFVNFGILHQEVPWPWLRTVAQNVACDLYRRSARLDAGDVVDTAPDMVDPGPGPEELMLSAEVTEQVRAALSTLRQRDRELLTMSVHQDMSVEDIASALGTPSGTVRVQLHRARKRLGTVYLSRVGTLAVFPFTAVSWVFRQLRRGSQPAATAVAPTVLSLAAAVVTVGVVGGAWQAGGDHATSIHGTKSMVKVAQSHHEARPAAAGGVRVNTHHAAASVTAMQAPRTASNDVDVVTPKSAAPVKVSATANVADDPTDAGRIHDDAIVLSGPIAGSNLGGHGDRDADSGAVCHFTGVGC